MNYIPLGSLDEDDGDLFLRANKLLDSTDAS